MNKLKTNIKVYLCYLSKNNMTQLESALNNKAWPLTLKRHCRKLKRFLIKEATKQNLLNDNDKDNTFKDIEDICIRFLYHCNHILHIKDKREPGEVMRDIYLSLTKIKKRVNRSEYARYIFKNVN